MAVQFANFLGAPVEKPDFSGISNLFENVLKGYQMAGEPERMREEEKKKALERDSLLFANALKKKEVEHKDTEYALDDARQQGLINKNQYDIAREKLELQNAPEENRLANLFKQIQIEKMKRELSDPFGGKGEKPYKVFEALPAQDKLEVTAVGRGMGLTPTETVRRLHKGETLESIAESKGINVNDVEKIYSSSPVNVRNAQNRMGFLEELKSLEKPLEEAIAPYSQKIYGYSPQQLADAIKNTDPDKQAKFLAARALQPELSALRLNVAGAKVGITAIQEMTNKSLGKSNIYEGLVKPQVYKKMQEYITKWVSDAGKAYNDKILKPAVKIEASESLGKPIKAPTIPSNIQTKEDYQKWISSLPKEQQAALQGEIPGKYPKSTVKIISPNGKLVDIPESEVNAALAAGGRRA